MISFARTRKKSWLLRLWPMTVQPINNEALELDNTQIVEELSLPPVKIHCSVLAEDAIKAAISDYKSTKNYFQSNN